MSKLTVTRVIIRLIMRIQKKLIVGVMLIVLVASSITPFLVSRSVEAQIASQSQASELIKSLKFKNSNTITGTFGGGDITFTKKTCPDPSGASTGFAPATVECFVSSSLVCQNNGVYKLGSGYVLRYNLRLSNGCAETVTQVNIPNIANAGNVNIVASRLEGNDTVIVGSDGKKYIKASDNLYRLDSEAGQQCQDFIQVSGNRAKLVVMDTTQSTGFQYRANANEASVTPQAFGGFATGSDERECGIVSINGVSTVGGGTAGGSDAKNDSIQKILANIGNTFALGKVTAAELAEIDGTEEDADGTTCETSDSGPLGWILCPVINAGARFTEFVFKDFVQPFLEDVPVSTNPEDRSYNAWKNFRLLGNILLVGTMLAVVYAQVRGDR